jgi:putative FmdB family regulatory protein
MPIYTYKCAKCGKDFELLVGVTSDKSEQKCPKCGSAKVARTLSTFAVSAGGGHDHGESSCWKCPAGENCEHKH